MKFPLSKSKKFIIKGFNKINKVFFEEILKKLDNLTESNPSSLSVTLKFTSDEKVDDIIDNLTKIFIIYNERYTLKKQVYPFIKKYTYYSRTYTLEVTVSENLKNLMDTKRIKKFSDFKTYLYMKKYSRSLYDYIVEKEEREFDISTKDLYFILDKELNYNSSNFNKVIKEVNSDLKKLFPSFSIEKKSEKGFDKKSMCGSRKENIFYTITKGKEVGSYF